MWSNCFQSSDHKQCRAIIPATWEHTVSATLALGHFLSSMAGKYRTNSTAISLRKENRDQSMKMLRWLKDTCLGTRKEGAERKGNQRNLHRSYLETLAKYWTMHAGNKTAGGLAENSYRRLWAEIRFWRRYSAGGY